MLLRVSSRVWWSYGSYFVLILGDLCLWSWRQIPESDVRAVVVHGGELTAMTSEDWKTLISKVLPGGENMVGVGVWVEGHGVVVRHMKDGRRRVSHIAVYLLRCSIPLSYTPHFTTIGRDSICKDIPGTQIVNC